MMGPQAAPPPDTTAPPLPAAAHRRPAAAHLHYLHPPAVTNNLSPTHFCSDAHLII